MANRTLIDQALATTIDTYITVKQAAELRGVTPERVRQWIRARRLHSILDPKTGLRMVVQGAVARMELLPRGRKAKGGP